LSAVMMCLCCLIASSSFTLRKSLFLSYDYLNSRMCRFEWFLLITIASSLQCQKRFSQNIVGLKSYHFLSCSFAEIVFSVSAVFSVSKSLLHICLYSSSCHNVLILLSLSGATNLSVCSACNLAYRCLQMKWWAAVTVVAIPSQKWLQMCPYVSSGKFSSLTPHFSRALRHNLQLTSDRCLIFASYLAARMIPAIAIISCL